MEAPLIYVNTHTVNEPGWPKRGAEIVMHPLAPQDATNFAEKFGAFLQGDNQQWQRFLSRAFVDGPLTNVREMVSLAQAPDTIAWGVSEVVRDSDDRKPLSDGKICDLARMGEHKSDVGLAFSGCAMVLELRPGGSHEIRQALFRTGRGIGTAVHLGRLACVFGQDELYLTARVFPGNVVSERAVRQGFVERPVQKPAPVVLAAPGPGGEDQLASPTHYVALHPDRCWEAVGAFLSARHLVPQTDPTPEFLHTLMTSGQTKKQMQRADQAVRIIDTR